MRDQLHDLEWPGLLFAHDQAGFSSSNEVKTCFTGGYLDSDYAGDLQPQFSSVGFL